MQDCAGFSSKAPWPSFQPPFLQHFAAGGRSCAATRLWRRTLWGDVTRVWRTKVAPEGCILLHEPSGQYFLNFGTSPLGYCNMLWPLEALSRSARGGKKHTLWSLKEISRRGELVWAPVVRMEDWWVVPHDVVSPAHLHVRVFRPDAAADGQSRATAASRRSSRTLARGRKLAAATAEGLR